LEEEIGSFPHGQVRALDGGLRFFLPLVVGHRVVKEDLSSLDVL
jgi:hypothetical protein